MPQFSPWLSLMQGNFIVLQDYSWTEEIGMLLFNLFLRSFKITTYFLKLIQVLFPPSWKLMDSMPVQSQNGEWFFFVEQLRISRLCILIIQLFGWPSHTHFCVTFSGKNVFYIRVGNFDSVFIYQRIPNFTNYEPLVTFENCKHHTSNFINWSITWSTISFIVLDVFSLLLLQSVYPQTYGAFGHDVYTVQMF